MSQQNLTLSRDSQSEELNKLYRIANDHIHKKARDQKNRNYSWQYGYNDQYDLIVISKTGQIGDIYHINGLHIALPLAPDNCDRRSEKASEQYWDRVDIPKQLARIQSIFQWHEMPKEFKANYVDYIEREFDRRDHGHWFMNNGKPTYITGSHYMYLQWSKIDIGYPDFREANRIFFIFWEACKADTRSFGMVYLKIRRSGFSFMSSSECVNIATLAKDARVGILSKTGSDAKKMFTDNQSVQTVDNMLSRVRGIAGRQEEAYATQINIAKNRLNTQTLAPDEVKLLKNEIKSLEDDLKKAQFTVQRKQELFNEYTAATNAAERANAFQKIEQELFNTVAKQFGFDESDVRAAWGLFAGGRSKAHNII